MPIADDPLIARIRHLGLPDRFGLVLHLGATVENFALHQRLPADLRVLVQGDSEAYQVLSSALPDWQQQFDGGLLAWPDVVAAQDGMVTWRQYSVRGLNGPLNVERLSSVYPRLTLLSVQQRQAHGVTGLVERALSAQDARSQGLPRLLILDIPGQEAGMIEALGAPGLEGFDWILFRGCREPFGDGIPVAEQAAERLATLHRACVWSSPRESGGLLVSELHRFDRVAKGLEDWRERALRAEAELLAVSKARDAVVAGAEALSRELERLRQELAAQVSVRESLEAAEEASRRAALQAELAAAAARSQEVEAVLEQARGEGARQAARAEEAEERCAQATQRGLELEKALAREHTRVHEQSQRADRHARLAEERAAELERANARLAEESARRLACDTELVTAQQRLQELATTLDQAGRERGEQAARADAAEQRCALATQQLSELEQALVREGAKVQEQSQRADRHARSAAEQQAAAEKLRAELSQATQQLQHATQQAQVTAQQLSSTREQVQTLQRQLQQSETLAAGLRVELQAEGARLATLKEELLRADSQLDLIKDLLLNPSLP